MIAKALVMFLQITITMLSPLLVCGWMGYMLDKRFHTTLWFLGLMILGVCASFRNFFHLVRGFYEKDLKDENAKLAYMEDMKRERERRYKEDKKDSQE